MVFKDKKLKSWWKKQQDKIQLSKQYFIREDFYNLNEKEIAEIRRKEKDPKRKVLVKAAAKFIAKNTDLYQLLDTDDEDTCIYFGNQLIDFHELMNKPTKEERIMQERHDSTNYA